MRVVSESEAKAHVDRLIDEVAASGEPIQIAGRRAAAVLVSDDDWRGAQETIYLLSIPGMLESILEGVSAPPEEWSEEPVW